MQSEKSVPFDPGFSKHTYVFSQSIETADQIMSEISAMHQKKFQYKVFAPKIASLYKSSCAFYLGCLLWASYLCHAFEEPKEIIGNPFQNTEPDEEEIFYEIDFLLNFDKKFEKDCKYYLGKPLKLDETCTKIIQTYREFLKLNENFKNAKTTNDLKLPSTLKPLSKEDCKKVLCCIEKVVDSGNLDELFEIKQLIFSDDI